MISRVIMVTLAETTPVEEAAQLQEDLRRADIEPFAWLVNRSLAASVTSDSVLLARARAEAAELRGARMLQALAGAEAAIHG